MSSQDLCKCSEAQQAISYIYIKLTMLHYLIALANWDPSSLGLMKCQLLGLLCYEVQYFYFTVYWLLKLLADQEIYVKVFFS